jgi:hypothetical protein
MADRIASPVTRLLVGAGTAPRRGTTGRHAIARRLRIGRRRLTMAEAKELRRTTSRLRLITAEEERSRITGVVAGLTGVVAEDRPPVTAPPEATPGTGKNFLLNNTNAARIWAAFLFAVLAYSRQPLRYPCFFTRTTVTLEKPSSNVGGLSLAAMRRITSSSTERSRRRLRSKQTSTGTSKKTAWTS